MSEGHGQCFISVDDNIIYLKSVGAFNLEGMIKAAQDIKAVVLTLDNNRFKLLADYTELEGATPEAFDYLDDFNVWLNKQNLVAKAVVINSAITLTILGQQVPTRKLQNDKNFKTKDEALEWLLQQD
jgi:hypothetical protein